MNLSRVELEALGLAGDRGGLPQREVMVAGPGRLQIVRKALVEARAERQTLEQMLRHPGVTTSARVRELDRRIAELVEQVAALERFGQRLLDPNRAGGQLEL